jgi:hypothetical protein
MGRFIKKKQNRIISYVLIIVIVGGLIYAYEGGYFNPTQVTNQKTSLKRTYNIGNTQASSLYGPTIGNNSVCLTKINVSSNCLMFSYSTYAKSYNNTNNTMAKFVLYTDKNTPPGNHSPYLLKYVSPSFLISPTPKWNSVRFSSYSLSPGIYWMGFIPKTKVKQSITHVQGNPYNFYIAYNSYQNPYQICGRIYVTQSDWACNYISVY